MRPGAKDKKRRSLCRPFAEQVDGMPNSMTGFGRSRQSIDGMEITAEVKAVNHRFFEFTAKTTRGFAFLEDDLKKLYAKKISRGKVDVYLGISMEEGDTELRLDLGAARSFLEALRSFGAENGLQDDLTVSALTARNDLFTAERRMPDEEAVRSNALKVAEEALDAFLVMRSAEGDRLTADLLAKLSGIEEMVSAVEVRSPERVQAYRDKLYERLSDLLGQQDIDPQRILTEAAIFADKTAVDEETVRLRSHIQEFRALLGAEEPVGRKLDFLVQEMNREINTIGSKGNDLEIARIVVDMKSELEKIREQIQNIE